MTIIDCSVQTLSGLGVFQNNTGDNIRRILKRIAAFFEIIINPNQGNGLDMIAFVDKQLFNRLNIEFIALVFQSIDGDDRLVKSFWFLKLF